jgi:hypothetical protein
MIFRKHQRSRRTRRAAIAAAAAVLAAALAPSGANAGTYQMYNCHVAGHETGNMGPWIYRVAYGAPNGWVTNGCAPPGGGFGYEFGAYFPGWLPANSRVDLTLDKDNSNIAMGATKLWFKAHTGSTPGYTNPIAATVWKDGATYVEWTGGQSPDYRSTPLDLNPTSSVTLSITCPAGGSTCWPDYPVPFEVTGVQTDLTENVKPGGMISGGTLTAPGRQTGTQTVVVDSTDADSGVRKVELLLDDKVVAYNDYNRDWTKPLSEQQAGTCKFDSWNACDVTRTTQFSVNTKLLPDGAYTLSTRVTDAAGNVTTTQAAQPVVIDNVVDPASPSPVQGVPGATGAVGAAGPQGGNGAGGGNGANGMNGAVLTINGMNGTAAAALKAAFATTERGTINAAYGKKVLITGKLTAPSGRPITGARVSVQLQDKMVGAKPVAAAEVVTDQYGTFRYVTTAVRSRTVRFGYRANLEDATFSQITDISLNVLPKVTLKTDKRSLRNGQTVRFSGSVAGAPANARKVVELQVKKGTRWMTFNTTRLRNGKFLQKYRFTATRGRKTYVFRARVRQEAGFPFLTGASRTVKVTVRG